MLNERDRASSRTRASVPLRVKQVSEFGPLTSRTDGKATCSYVQVTLAVLVLVLSLLDLYCQLTTACSSYNVLFFYGDVLC